MSGTTTTTTKTNTITTTVSVFDFAPSATSSPPFSFSFTTEGSSYTGQAMWNMAGQRWYLEIYDSAQNLLINHPLVSSPTTSPQNLAPGIFKNTIISYNETNAQITVTETTTVELYPVSPVPYLNL